MKAKKAKARAAQGLGSVAEARRTYSQPAQCSAARAAQSWSGGARINYLHLTNERS